MTKNKIYGSLIKGDKVTPKTKYEQELRNRFNDIMIARELKIPIHEVHNMPSTYYQDLILIVNKEIAYKKIEQQKREKQQTKNNRKFYR